jgi:hypothetical protein
MDLDAGYSFKPIPDIYSKCGMLFFGKWDFKKCSNFGLA